MKSKLLILALVLILLSTSVFALRTFERTDLRPGLIYRMELNQSNLALTHNYFSLKRSLPYVKLIMQRITGASSPSILNNTYAYFRIAPEGMTNDDLKNAELEFKIPETWFKGKEYDKSMVTLKVFDEFTANWDKLPTRPAGTISGAEYFLSDTDRFGFFAATIEFPVVEEKPKFAEVVREPGIIRAAPKKKGLRDLFEKIPGYAHLLLLGLVISMIIIIALYSRVNKLMHPYPDLTQYVKNSLQKGRELSEIRKILIDAGWPKDLVDNELKTYSQKEERSEPRELEPIELEPIELEPRELIEEFPGMHDIEEEHH